MADNLDKLKSDLINQFNKEFPDSPLEQMDESNLAEVPGWMTTGNLALNWIISKDINKGLPMGRVILFTGDPGSGKCAHEDTLVKLINQNEKAAKEYIQQYTEECTEADLSNMEFDCISFDIDGQDYIIPEKCQLLTKNRGFIFAEDLTEKDDVFFVENITG